MELVFKNIKTVRIILMIILMKIFVEKLNLILKAQVILIIIINVSKRIINVLRNKKNVLNMILLKKHVIIDLK